MPRDLRLSEFTQTIAEIGDSQAYNVLTFPGVDPIVVKADRVPVVYMQSGSAKTFNCWFVPPTPAGTLLGQPTITRTLTADGLHWVTSWSYQILVNGGLDKAAIVEFCRWPASPVIEELDT